MQAQVRGKGARWITFGVIAVGSLFLVIGLVLTGMSVSFLAHADRAPGTVVALERRTDHSGGLRKKRVDDRPVAHPMVEFTPADGTRRTFRASVGSRPPAYDEGDRVEVLYDADSPDDARIDGFASLWLLPLVFGGFGLVATGIGTAAALAMRRRSRAAISLEKTSAPAAP